MGVDQELAQISNTLVYSAMFVYTLALLAFTADLSGRGRVAREPVAADAERELVGAGGPPAAAGTTQDPGADAGEGAVRRKAAGIAVSLTWLAFFLHAGAVVTRGLAVGRVPWGNMYEFTVTGAAVVTGVFLATLVRRDLRFLGTFVTGPVLLSLGVAIAVLYTEASELVPALKSVWLIIHVSVAFVSSALFCMGFSLVILYVVQDRREERKRQGTPSERGAFMDNLPAAAALDRTAYRLHAIAFPLWTFTLIAGSIWAEKSWGRYWNWDPKEVWTFVIWVVYAGYLHARATRGWDGRRATYLAMAGFACLMFNFFGVNYFFSGLHSYA